MMSEIGAIVPIRRDEAGRVVMLDQTRLPNEEIYHAYERAEQVADAITTMVIRGAPAIGVAAAMGLALGARQLDRDDFLSGFSGLRLPPPRATLLLFVDRYRRPPRWGYESVPWDHYSSSW